MERVFGIDFGTTSSAIVGAIKTDNGIHTIFYGAENGSPIPSLVAISRDTGTVLTGLSAKNNCSDLAKTYEIIYSVKSILDTNEKIELASGTWRPIDIATELFGALKLAVKKRTGENMNKAVVAIPVGFSMEKRKCLREAAAIAGIQITSFISEPTAAFFSNYDKLKSATNIVVFDWGGGTLDVSVLRNENGNIYELSKSGRDIAGDFIDEKLAKQIHARIAQKKGNESNFKDMSFAEQRRLKLACEHAKIMLSDFPVGKIWALNYGQYGIIREELLFDNFCEIIEPEIKMAMLCL